MDESQRPGEGHDSERPREPRTGGAVGGLAPIQIALALLVVLLGLIVLMALWPLLSGG